MIYKSKVVQGSRYMFFNLLSEFCFIYSLVCKYFTNCEYELQRKYTSNMTSFTLIHLEGWRLEAPSTGEEDLQSPNTSWSSTVE